jgi:hypothetical protein
MSKRPNVFDWFLFLAIFQGPLLIDGGWVYFPRPSSSRLTVVFVF